MGVDFDKYITKVIPTWLVVTEEGLEKGVFFKKDGSVWVDLTMKD